MTRSKDLVHSIVMAEFRETALLVGQKTLIVVRGAKVGVALDTRVALQESHDLLKESELVLD